MGWPSPGPATVVAGQLMTAAFWNTQVRDALAFLKGLHDMTSGVGRARWFGGSPNQNVGDTAFVLVPSSVVVELDGTSLANATSIEVHATCFVQSGTGTLRLFCLSTGLAIGSPVTFTATTPTLTKLTGLVSLFGAGVKQYRLEVHGATAVDNPCVYGAELVVR